MKSDLPSQDDLRALRRIERHMRREQKKGAPMRLRDYVASKVPLRLLPGNIGSWEEVMWDFIYDVQFSFGENPDYDALSVPQTQSFKNSQPYAMLIYGISRKHWDDQIGDNAGESLPLQMRIIDAQSTRQYTPQPVAMQSIGKFGNITVLDVPIVLAPSGQIDVELSLMPEQLEIADYNWEGNSVHDFSFYGKKVRYQNPARGFIERWI